MKRLLIFLIMVVLVAGGVIGILYLNQAETDPDNMVSRSEARQMAKEAAEKARLECRASQEEPKEEPKEEPAVEEPKEKPKKEPKPAPAKPKEEVHYYRYTVKTREGRLHLRLSPNGKIVGKIPSGSTGYVIQRGDEWSLIESDDLVVYASNNFLIMEEVQKKDFPTKYRKVTAANVGKKVGE